MASHSQQAKKSVIRENIEAIIIAVLLALFIRTFIVQAFKIPSGSMLPTLQIGDHILVSKFIYGVKMPFTGKTLVPITDPKPHDIVVFQYPKDPQLDYIKRVIAVAGDTVEIRNKIIYVNGKRFDEPHAQFQDNRIYSKTDSCNFNTWDKVPHMHSIDTNCPRDNIDSFKVPPHKIFCMGDNRDNSYDGRFWGFVDLSAVRGKAWAIYWSWDVQQPLFSLDRLRSIRWGRIGDIVH
ncbi:MAG: signal peptidase I [Desulfobulbus sp.]|nr:signal peptidase I [Desulfobulbus sp.]